MVLRHARRVHRPKDAADAIHSIASHWEADRWTTPWPWPLERVFTEERLARRQPDASC